MILLMGFVLYKYFNINILTIIGIMAMLIYCINICETAYMYYIGLENFTQLYIKT